MEIGGYERDPVHVDEAEHMHCTIKHGHHVRRTASSISFKDAIAKAWEYLSTGTLSQP